MPIENAVVETVLETQVQEQGQVQEQKKQEQESRDVSQEPFMKAVLIKRGEYTLSNSFVLPSLDVCLLGEQGTVLAPEKNVLAILGVGKDDVKCSKCGNVLAMKIKRPQVQNIAIKCPSCGSLNEL